jgi:hypothetical protein
LTQEDPSASVPIHQIFDLNGQYKIRLKTRPANSSSLPSQSKCDYAAAKHAEANFKQPIKACGTGCSGNDLRDRQGGKMGDYPPECGHAPESSPKQTAEGSGAERALSRARFGFRRTGLLRPDRTRQNSKTPLHIFQEG